MCDSDPAIAAGAVTSTPRIASEIAADAGLKPTTVDGVLSRLVDDRRVTLGTTTRKTTPTARQLTTYRLNPDGLTYARTILRLAKAEHDAACAETGE